MNIFSINVLTLFDITIEVIVITAIVLLAKNGISVSISVLIYCIVGGLFYSKSIQFAYFNGKLKHDRKSNKEPEKVMTQTKKSQSSTFGSSGISEETFIPEHME